MADRRSAQPPHHRSYAFRTFQSRLTTDSSFRYSWIPADQGIIDGHICWNDGNLYRQQIPNLSPPPMGEESSYWHISDEETIILELYGDYNRTPQENGFPKQSISDHILKRSHHASGNQETDLCVVCQSEYEDGENLGRLRCGHEYHDNCIARWLLVRKFCPVCKQTA